MVSLDEAVIARLKTHGETFEIFVDPDLALEYKEGDDINFSELLAVETVFKDASAGEKASEQRLQELFGTADIKAVAQKILAKGEVHLTTEQRRKKLEDRRKQIVAIIARNAINPQTGKPHPPARIERALEEARFTVLMNKSAKEQVESALKLIKPIIPIKFASLECAVKIPAHYAGSCYSALQGFGEVKKEEWSKTGDLLCLINMPAGLQDEFFSKLNGLTHGEVTIKILEK